jgi:hypothetical protein
MPPLKTCQEQIGTVAFRNGFAPEEECGDVPKDLELPFFAWV